MRRLLFKLLVAALALCWVPLRAQEGRITSDSKRTAQKFPQELQEGADAVFARLKVVSAPNSPRAFIPFAYVRRLQPEQHAGKWLEQLVVMPGSRVEPDLRERVLRDFRKDLPRQLAAKMINAYLVLYEESGAVHLVVCDRPGSETRFRAVRPKNLHELKLGDFELE